MLSKPAECELSGCPLAHYRNSGFAQPEGTCSNGVLVIAEALGENEKLEGLALRPYAESGSAFQTAINNLKHFGINYDRSEFGIFNIVNCQPPFNKLEGTKYEAEAVSCCKSNYLDKVVEYFNPKVIFTLGNIPLKYLTPEIASLQADTKIKLDAAKAQKDKALENYYKSQAKKLKIMALRGYKFDSIYGIPLVPSLHPSYIARTGRVLMGVLLRDLVYAINIANGQQTDEFKYENYFTHPSPEDAIKFYNYCKANPDLDLCYDIETPFTKLEVDEAELEFGTEARDIDSIQFSIANTTARKNIFFPWDGVYKDVSKNLLSLPNAKVGWNSGKFDESVLEYQLGKGSINGLKQDAMWLWKHLNADFIVTGKALQFAANFYTPELKAWKHISESDPIKYGLIDVDITLKTFLDMKEQMSNVKNPAPGSKNLFQGYIDDIVKLFPILKRMSERGFPVNVEAREKLKVELEEKRKLVLETLQDKYPTELRRPDPPLGYKRVPKEVDLLTQAFEDKYCTFESMDYLIFIDEEIKELALSRFIEQKSRRIDGATKKDTVGQTGLVIREFIVDGEKVRRYCRLDRFKPSSTQQVASYLRYKKYKIKTKRKGKKESETTDKNALYDLYQETKDEFLLEASYERELKNLVKTFINGWPTDANGRVHSTFLPLPVTGQLSSTKPNIHNMPSHGNRYSSKDYVEIAQKLRNTIQAKPGHTLVSSDWSAFHAIMLGVEAGDATYIALARKDIHSYVAAHMLRDEYYTKYKGKVDIKGNKIGTELVLKTLDHLKDLNNWLNLKDDELITKLKWIKSNHPLVRNAQAKPAILGVGFGMGVKKFYTLNKHAFASMEQPRRILTLLKKLFPPVFAWQDWIVDLAHKQTYLVSRYGYIRRFWDIYDFRLLSGYRPPNSEYEKILKTKDGKYWSRTDGTQKKEAIAYLPANNAFGKKKEAMRDLEELGMLEKYGLINEIHDDLMFECPNEFVDECVVNVSKIMQAPARHIITDLFPAGVACMTEVKIGSTWANMEGYSI